MKNRFLCLLLPIFALILEISPYGAVCNFANPEGEPWRKTFSYFDLTPFGYANFAPFFTAILTCVVFLLLVIYCVTGKEQLARIAKNVLGVGVVISFAPLLFGISFFSVVGLLISLSLIGELGLLQFKIKKSTK